MQLSGQKVTVVGLGVSGLAAARVLASRGAIVTVNDARDRQALRERAREAEALGAALDLGGHDGERLRRADLIVVSPGVPPLDALEQAQAAGVPVISEVELASRFVHAPIVAITGTNGKSTVTTLVGEMCRRSGRPTFVGGNLGTPLMDVVDHPAAREDGLVVVELSSFQLERVERFRAHVAVLLNVTPDHLDRYADFQAYAAAKARIFERQGPEDYAVLPAGDERCHRLAAGARSTRAMFGVGGEVHVAAGALRDEQSGLSIALDELPLTGAHNYDNACAAALAGRLLGLGVEPIRDALLTARGLPHRMQRVARVGEVTFYDDSKATNVGAAVAALRGLEGSVQRVVLIAGGKDKGGSYQPLVEALARKGRAVVLIGQAADRIEAALEGSGIPAQRAEGMEDAVRRALEAAEPGDAVLLAPACSSFDMFSSYGERGDAFQAAVRAVEARS